MVNMVRQHRVTALQRVVFAVYGDVAERAFRDALQSRPTDGYS